MIYNSYGQTGKKVSAIGFGGMRFEKDKFDESAELVRVAYDSGINYFDTAPQYIDSEEVFGIAFKDMLKNRQQKPFYVSTKSMKAKPGEIRRDIETSLKRMGLDYIDFYHCWCIYTLGDYYDRKAKGALEEFTKLKEEGLIKHVCVSTHVKGSDVKELLSDYPFEGVLMGYSVMNFSFRQKGLHDASEMGRGVVVMNPLGGGLIPQHPELFNFVKTKNKESVVEAALRFLLNDGRISSAIVGFNSKEQIAEAISAVNGFEPIAESEVERIHDDIKGAFDKLCTSCGYCDKCPMEIPVPKMMFAYNQLALTKKAIEMVNCIYWHWGIDLHSDVFSKCVECGLCERLCTQKLPIIKRLKEINFEVKEHLKQQGDNQTK